MTQAIGYIRRSTSRQEESLQQQQAKLESFAVKNGWTLKAVYSDDAISGSDMKRPGLEQLMAAATSDSTVEIVLAWDRNRLARPKEAIDGMLLERRLQTAGKRVIYAATGQEADGSFTSGLISYVEHHQNGDYLRKLSRDTMRGTVDRAKRGLWPGGPIPFGYDRLIVDGDTPKRIVRDMEDGSQNILDPETGKVIDHSPKGRSHKKQDHESCVLIPSDPARVRAVQRMFADYAAGKPTRQIRDQLNESGFVTSRGSSFTPQTIIPILESPAYLGQCVYNRRTLSKWHRYQEGSSAERADEGVEKRSKEDWVICDNAWPALVDRDTFDRVQAVRKASREKYSPVRGHATRSNYLLTGLMACGICGGRLTGSTTTNQKGYKTKYYLCNRHAAGHKHECPKRYTVPAKVVEEHIVSLIHDDLVKLRDDEQLHQLVESELNRLHGGKSDDHDQLQRRIASLDQQLAKLRDHLLTMDAKLAQSLGLYDQAQELTQERTELESELAACQLNRVELPPTALLRQRIATEFDRLGEVLAGGTLEEKRQLISLYVQKIKADPDQQTVHISLYPTLLSQKIAGTGFEPATSGL